MGINLRISLFEIEIERDSTFLLSILKIDDGFVDTSLFEIGWYQGHFSCDILFVRGLISKIFFE